MTRYVIKTAYLAIFLGSASMVSGPAMAINLVYGVCVELIDPPQRSFPLVAVHTDSRAVLPEVVKPGANCFDAYLALLTARYKPIKNSKAIQFLNYVVALAGADDPRFEEFDPPPEGYPPLLFVGELGLPPSWTSAPPLSFILFCPDCSR